MCSNQDRWYKERSFLLIPESSVFFFPRENFWISKMAVKTSRFWKFSWAILSLFTFFYYKNPKLPVKFFEKGGREIRKCPWKWSKSIFFTDCEKFHGEKKKHWTWLYTRALPKCISPSLPNGIFLSVINKWTCLR